MCADESPSTGQREKCTTVQPEEPCTIPPRAEWSEPEKWVWHEVCQGRIADFNKKCGKLDPKYPDGWAENREISAAFLRTVLTRDPYQKAVAREGVRIVGALVQQPINLENASLSRQWWLDESRIERDMSLECLEGNGVISFENSAFGGAVTLAMAKVGGELNMNGAKCSGPLKMNRLNVSGALLMGEGAQFNTVDLSSTKVAGELNMNDATCSCPLNMDGLEVAGSLYMSGNAKFMKIDLRSAKVGGQFSMIGASCTGSLIMNSLEVICHVFMGDGAHFDGDIDLRSAKVGGHLDMVGAICSGTLNMNSLAVTGSLLMDAPAKFAEVRLTGATVGGQLSMIGAKCSGPLNMDSLSVAGPLLMSGDAQFNGMDLRSAKVGGQLDMTGASCTGSLVMSSLKVNSHLFMAKVCFEQRVSLVFADIGGLLDISGAHLNGLDLTETSIRGELLLDSEANPKPIWQTGSRLILRNTVVSTIQAPKESDAFPKGLDLAGFTYTRLGGLSRTGEETQMASYEVEWFVEWLKKDTNYSPQPYQQLAGILRIMGHPSKANTILFEGKQRERSKAIKRGHRARWLGLTLLRWTIGYGCGSRYFLSLIPVVLFTMIGALVVSTTCTGKDWNVIKMLGFSFDQLLPLVKLDESHAKILSENIKSGWQYYYFYLHKLVGYVLGSFVLAGLSGITKK
jgi:uncharacterized protein YjbI with pentapeptide repeats